MPGASPRLRPIVLTLFSTSTDSPLNREAARLLAYLDEPSAVPLIVEHQASVSDLKAQIHDAYCLRAMKNGWTAETKERLWSWYQKSSGWEGGYSFQGYLDMMIQELVALLDARRKSNTWRGPRSFRFRRGCWFAGWTSRRTRVRSLRSRRCMGSSAGGEAIGVRLPTCVRSIIEKLGNDPQPVAQGALRELYQKNPGERDAIARALAAHPAEESLSILVAALDSRDSNTTSLILRRAGPAQDRAEAARRHSPA